MYKFVRRKKRICGFAEVFSPQKNWVLKSQIRKSQKYWDCKSQIRKLPHVQKVRNYKNFVSPQMCGLAIYGTYLRTAHLCRMHNILCKKSANNCFQFRTGGGGGLTLSSCQ